MLLINIVNYKSDYYNKSFNFFGTIDFYVDDFNRKWYIDVGPSIIIAMFLNIFLPHLVDFIKFL